MSLPGWRERTLGSCAKFISGGTPDKSRPEFWNGDIPWVSSGEMGESFIFDTSLKISIEAARAHSKLIPARTVLVVVRGMSLAKEFRVALTKVQVAFNQDLKALICVDDVNPEFLFYALRARSGYIRERATEASHGTKKLESEVLLSVKLKVPNLAAQKRVVEAISAYDEMIHNNRRRIGLLEEAARLLYREWFVHLRFPGHEHVKITDGTPEGWEKKAASEAFEVNPSTPRSDDGTISYVPMAALSEAGMTVDPSAIERRQASTSVRFRNGDTLLARITPCLENGKTGFVYFLDDGEIACGSTEFIVLRGRNVSNLFVYLTAREDTFRGNAIKSMIGASGRQRVQPECLDRYQVPVPPKLIAEMFDEAVSKMFMQIETLDKQSHKLATARDLLLPRLMSGELAV